MNHRYQITCPSCGRFAAVESFGSSGPRRTVRMGCGCALEVSAPMAAQMRRLADGLEDVALCDFDGAWARLERGPCAA